jgi:hypothetical protein
MYITWINQLDHECSFCKTTTVWLCVQLEMDYISQSISILFTFRLHREESWQAGELLVINPKIHAFYELVLRAEDMTTGW